MQNPSVFCSLRVETEFGLQTGDWYVPTGMYQNQGSCHAGCMFVSYVS